MLTRRRLLTLLGMAPVAAKVELDLGKGTPLTSPVPWSDLPEEAVQACNALPCVEKLSSTTSSGMTIGREIMFGSRVYTVTATSDIGDAVNIEAMRSYHADRSMRFSRI